MTSSRGRCRPTAPGRKRPWSEGSMPSRPSSSWPKRARRRPTDRRRMLEREVKLAAPPAFTLPDLDDLAAAIETTPVDEQRLETVYYDTPDLRLARWGCNLRLRHGEGWTLKLPTTGGGPVLARRELEFPGDASRPPDAAVALVIGYTRRSALVPVATLSTLRRRGPPKKRRGAGAAAGGDDAGLVVQGGRGRDRVSRGESGA